MHGVHARRTLFNKRIDNAHPPKMREGISNPKPGPQAQTFPLGESTWTTDLSQYMYDTISDQSFNVHCHGHRPRGFRKAGEKFACHLPVFHILGEKKSRGEILVLGFEFGIGYCRLPNIWRACIIKFPFFDNVGHTSLTVGFNIARMMMHACIFNLSKI